MKIEQNELYPVFLKVAELEVLIVGGGKVGLEKLTFLLKSSPNAKATVVAQDFSSDFIAFAEEHKVNKITAEYKSIFLENKQIVIAATNDLELNLQIHSDCKQKNILVNVADNPPYCDFYMGGIVTKGNVKIGISTNGKSPTTAKRLRQFFEEVIPEDINELVNNLNQYRKTIKGDFEQKVERLNNLTKELLPKKRD